MWLCQDMWGDLDQATQHIYVHILTEEDKDVYENPFYFDVSPVLFYVGPVKPKAWNRQTWNIRQLQEACVKEGKVIVSNGFGIFSF